MSSLDVISKWHQLTNFYTHLTHHIVPGPNSSCYFIPCILLPLALLIPPSKLSHNSLCLVFVPIMYACQIHAWSIGGMDVISINLTLWSFVLLVLRDPRKTHRRIWVYSGTADGKGSEGAGERIVEEPYPVDIQKRIAWVLTLLVSLRLTGWKIGEQAHDRRQPPPRLSRSAFLKVALSTVVQSYLILDVASSYVQTDPYFTTSGMGVGEPFPTPTPEMPTLLVVLRLLPPRVVRSSVLAGQIYGMVTSLFFIPTLPAVGLNVLGLVPDEWSPQTWPVFFGDFSAIGERGLRGLWGSWWHRMNKQITATHGRAAAETMGIHSNSTPGYALSVISAFFFSGIIHMGMIPPRPESALLTANMMRFYVAVFFWVQILAFGVELIASKLVAHFVPTIQRRSVTKTLVLLWAAAWLCLTLPLLTIPFREIGYWHYYGLPVSVIRGLGGAGWMAW